jgi:Tfp pilus assembly protein PilN
MDIKLLKNISIAKIAGLKKILAVEILDDSIRATLFQRKKNLLKIINKPVSPEDFAVIFNETLDKDFAILSSAIKSYLIKYKIKELYLVLGITECKYQKITVPSDTEDDELWFVENTDKFIPEGRSNSEFIYSYQKIKEDDYYRYYFIVTARKDYIESVIKACDLPGVKILCALPFHSSMLILKEFNEESHLSLIFLNARMQYVYNNEEGNFEIGEIYYSNYADSNVKDKVEEALAKCIQSFIPQKSVQIINTILSCPLYLKENIKRYLEANISSQIKFIELKIESEILPAAFSIVNIYEDPDTQINLLCPDSDKYGRDSLEKKLWLNVTFAGSILIIFLLLISNSLSLFLNNIQLSRNEETAALTARQQKLTKLKNENKYYETNLEMLSKLKNDRNIYSNLLLSINDVTGARSCLSGLEIKNDKNILSINLTGLARSQTDVSDLLKKIGTVNGISNVSLVYSSVKEDENSQDAGKSVDKGFIQFNIKCNYNGY